MRYARLLTAALVLPLAACSAEGEKAEASPTIRAAQPDQTPEAFVRALYANDGGVNDGRYWSARTAALIAETERLTPEGFVGFFEADPICDCQDGTPVLESAIATSTGPDSADVAIVQTFAEPGNATHRKTYRLVREVGAWKIDDMTYQDMGEFPQGPLVERLTTWIAEVKSDPSAFKGE